MAALNRQPDYEAHQARKPSTSRHVKQALATPSTATLEGTAPTNAASAQGAAQHTTEQPIRSSKVKQ